MPKDMFAASLVKRTGPPRSKWTIAGSIILHVVLLAALLVVPVLSAFDSYVVHARNLAFVLPPPAVMPAIPAPPPPKTQAPAAPTDIKPAAPAHPPENPVVGEREPLIQGPPIIEGALRNPGSGPGFVPGGTGSGPVTIAPPPPAPRTGPLRIGGKISAPGRLAYVPPVYPPLAIIAKKEGQVTLEATIDETGIVRDVKVLQGDPLLNQAAVDAVRKWRYTPTKLNGVAVPVLLTVTVTFTLR
jgi:protein TonB